MQRQQLHLILDALLDVGERISRPPMPPEAAQHFRAARREALLGLRSLLDAAIERAEAPPAPAAPAGPTPIKIEADGEE